MRIRVYCFLVAAVALCLVGATAGAVQIVYDNFDADPVASGTPPGWTATWNTGTDGAIVELVSGSGDHQFRIHDLNGNNGYQCLATKTFAAVTETSGSGTGIVIAQADIAFSVNTAAFIVVLGDGATTGNKVAARIQWEGKIAWETGGGTGRLSWYSYYNGSAAVTELLENPMNPGFPCYFGGVDGNGVPTTWYTFKIIANVGTTRQTVNGVTVDPKCFHFYFGPKGGALEDIDQYASVAQSPDVGIPFYKYDTAGNQVRQLTTLQFASSAKKIEDEQYVWIDNVSVIGDISVTNCATVADAKNAPSGSVVRLANKIVTAGTDQLLGGFFYIQDETGGIRVRPYPVATVHQGDKVTVSGVLARNSEAGAYVKRVGEKEITGQVGGIGTQIDITQGPFPLPKPTALNNKAIGGGNFGPMEADGYVAQPGAYRGDGDISVPVGSRLQDPASGLCNIGRYVRAFGRVIYSDRQRNPGTGGYFFYIDDGSGVLDGTHFVPAGESDYQKGIRVYCKNLGNRLDDIEGKYCLVTGIVGAIGAYDSAIRWGAGASSWQYCNVPVIRPVEEVYTDANQNGVYDIGEPYIDSNGNGVWDGIIFVP